MTIRDRGKEWVTSEADKEGCSGRSRRKMQTAIAPRTLTGPVTSGATQPRIGPEGDPGQEAPAPDGVEAFASVMLEKPAERDASEADTPSSLIVAEPALPLVAFWPVLKLQPGAADTVAAEPGPTVTAETPFIGNPKLADAAAFVVLPSAEGGAVSGAVGGAVGAAVDGAVGGVVGGATVPLAVPAGMSSATGVLAHGALTLPPGISAEGASPPNPSPIVAGQVPDLSRAAAKPLEPISGPAAETLPVLDDRTRPPASLPLAAFAAQGPRFLQAMPLPDAAKALEPLGDEEGTPDLGDMAKTDKLAQLTSAITPASALPAIAPPTVLVAKLAETALQSLFAAQAEAAARDMGEGESLGLLPHGMTPAAHAASFVATPPAVVPTLAAQLVQTLGQRPDGTTEIALSPDELGHVRVTLQADANDPDRIVVMLNFERPETLDLFRRHADQLADALRNAGYSGADIGFGRSDGGENRNSGAEVPLPDPSAADHSLVEPLNGHNPHQPALRLAATSTLDLRL